MKSRIFIVLILITLFLPIVHSAYADYGINEINVSQSIKEGDDLNYSLVLSNNSSSTADINVITSIIAPTGQLIYTKTTLYNVLSNKTTTFTSKIRANIDVNFKNSTDPYSVYSVITNEIDGSITNNTYTQYFTVRKGTKKIPIPDMPIILGVVLAISIAFILTRDQKVTKKKK
jgi:hypothetical protein